MQKNVATVAKRRIITSRWNRFLLILNLTVLLGFGALTVQSYRTPLCKDFSPDHSTWWSAAFSREAVSIYWYRIIPKKRKTIWAKLEGPPTPHANLVSSIDELLQEISQRTIEAQDELNEYKNSPFPNQLLIVRAIQVIAANMTYMSSRKWH